MKHIFFLILSVLAFSGCQNGEINKKRALECYVRFLAPESQTRAEATLFEGAGETDRAAVEIPGGIRYQGLEMKALPRQNITYRLEKAGGFGLKHGFSWKDEKGEGRAFEMQISPITDFSFGSNSLSRQTPAILRWTGLPLEKGEVLVFIWENAALGQTVPMEIAGVSDVPSVEFPAVKLAELAPGQWTLYLVRKKLTKAEVKGVSASGVIEYYTKTDTLLVR